MQDVCPGRPADHVTVGTSDAVSWALALDALTHDGPADPARIDRSACLRPFMPGVRPATFPLNAARAGALLAATQATYPHTFAEPPLESYTRPTAG